MLSIHRAHRADRLVAALADLLAEPAGDPFAPELVAVHSRGIERWLAQELSARLGSSPGRGDGVCANVEFPFPGQVLGRVLAASSDVDADRDPWSPARLVWPLMETITDHIGQPWLSTLRGHLGSDDPDVPRRSRRFAVARHLADLFDRYAVHRPAMLRRWAAGRDVDGAGGGLSDDLTWQPRLWRHVRERLGVPSLAERLDHAIGALRDGLDPPDVPQRLSLFGLTALPAIYVDVLAALAGRRSVHLFLLHPSPGLWDRVAATLGPRPGPLLRDEDPTRDLPCHRLLGSWGRDAREMQVVLHGAGGQDVCEEPEPPGAAGEATLLARLQGSVRDDEAPPGAPAPGAPDRRVLLDPGDVSVQVHACHGRTRQVEVLRDAIGHLLGAPVPAGERPLEPRDVVVMCPDIETFAPIVQAVFGATVAGTDAHGLPNLRVRLADRALRQTNPVLRVIADLLTLADGRLTAPEVLDLAAREPVRRRFAFDDEALERLEQWVSDARVRWGLDGGHRAAFGLAGIETNTWQSGLERLLLGVAMADEDDRLVGGTVPLDDVEGSDVDIAGRLAEFVARLAEAVAALRGPATVDGWQRAIRLAADLLTASAERDRWQHAQLHRILDDVVAEATAGDRPSAIRLGLAEVRSLLEDRLAGRPSRANHRTGDLTVCTLVPMRSVPHKVVCLLGMDDGAFPRRVVGDGDDLVERDPRVGDRNLRTEDRQLLLDALLAADRALVVTYTGRDERTNEERPPAVPVGELLDTIDQTARTGEGGSAVSAVCVHHPLQTTDARNFDPGALGRAGPWGFDRSALAGARARARGPAPPRPFVDGPLPVEDTDVIDLAELVRFCEHPVRTFLRRRLGVSLPGAADEPGDAIPVEPSGLDGYEIGDRLLTCRLAGGDLGRWEAAERVRGVLPPGRLAEPVLAEARNIVGRLVEAAAKLCDVDAAPERLGIALPLADGRTLLGTVPGVCGDVLLAVRYSKVRPKQRVAAWVRLVAATAAHPERPLRAVTVGRHDGGSTTKEATSVRLPPLGDGPDGRRRAAAGALAVLVDLYDRGLREPLPLACRTSEAFAAAAVAGDDPVAAANRRWVTEWQYPYEDRDPEHLLVHGEALPLDDLLGERPRDDEAGPGWGEDERRFGRYARRLWDPILAVEEVEHW